MGKMVWMESKKNDSMSELKFRKMGLFLVIRFCWVFFFITHLIFGVIDDHSKITHSKVWLFDRGTFLT